MSSRQFESEIMLKAIQPVESMKNTIIWSKDKVSRFSPSYLWCYGAFGEDACSPNGFIPDIPDGFRKGKAFYKKMRLRLTFYTGKAEYLWSQQRAKRPLEKPVR